MRIFPSILLSLILISCGSKPSEIRAIDATTPKEKQPVVDTSTLEKPLSEIREGVGRASEYNAASEELVRQLRLDTLASKTNAEKLQVTVDFLSKSRELSEQQIADTAKELGLVVAEYNRQNEARDQRELSLQFKLQTQSLTLKTVQGKVQELESSLSDMKVQLAKKTAWGESYKQSYEALSITAHQAIEDRDKMQKSEWKVKVFNYIAGFIAVYFIAKLVLNLNGIRII